MSAAGRLPDFLILGAQKAGTTSLAAWLARHHACFIAPEKEVHYFDLGLAKGEAWYRSRFAAAPWRARAGEATPYYLFHPACAARIARTLPAAKLVVILRDPVECPVRCAQAFLNGFKPHTLDLIADRTPKMSSKGLLEPASGESTLGDHITRGQFSAVVLCDEPRRPGDVRM